MTLIKKLDTFFWITIVLLVILCPIGAAVGTYHLLSPETFWHRIAAIVIGFMAMSCSLVPFGFIMWYLNGWFEKWLMKRRKNRERQQADERQELERRMREVNR